MITPVVLVKTSVSFLHNYHSFLVVGSDQDLVSYQLQAYNVVLLTIISILCIQSPGLN